MRLSAQQIARQLGGAKRTGKTFMARCPCHRDGTASLALRDGVAGVLVYCHAGCSNLDVIASLRDLGLWDEGERRRELLPPPVRDRDFDNRIAFARAIWNAAGDPHGTLGERYLAQRGLALPDNASRVFRFHSRCPFGNDVHHPTLLAAFHPLRQFDGEPQAVHRVALTPRGEKIEKKMLGPVGGCAIKLDPDEAVELGLGVCEGFETGLGVKARGWRPMWALGNAGAIAKLEVIPGIEALTIFADNDANGTGARAAAECGERWTSAGCECATWLQTAIGSDFADGRQ